MRFRMPTCSIPTRTAFALAAAVWGLLFLAGSCALAADEKSDRERKVRVAIAVAEAEAAARKRFAAVAPMPRAAAPKALAYDEGHKKAAADQLPLVVYVGCEPRAVPGTVAVKVESYPRLDSPGVVVGYPCGGRMFEEKVFEGGCPAVGEIEKAAEKARRKIDAKPMPATKDAPLPEPGGNFMIRAEPAAKGVCSFCGDACKCKAGDCPGKCPVQQAQASRQLTYAECFAKVKAGHRVTLAVGMDCPTCEAKCGAMPGVPAGVYECYLQGGVPTMLPLGGCPLKPARRVD